ELARQRSDAWSPSVASARTAACHEVQGRASYALWEATQSEEDRLEARNRTADWAEYLRRINKDAGTAMSLCASAAGGAAVCDKRVQTEAVTESVQITSVPMGATVVVDGREVGRAPVTVELTHGTHQVRLVLGPEAGEHAIRVGGGEPVRWQWRATEDGWLSL
ncbi:MAG: PEGA domain-containing protein, partial [Myxococcales bacterium]|nr:PEGA domain-containing protein [Myxococcales bacterium]